MNLQMAESERIADENERATLFDEQFTQAALEAVRAKAKPQSHPDFDGEHCVDCEDAIAPERLALGRVRCVPCQEYVESEARRYRQTPLWIA